MTEPSLTITEYRNNAIYEVYQAPIYSTDPRQWSALEFLNALSEHPNAEFNFADWKEQRGYPLIHATALTLEYVASQTSRIVTALSDLQQTFYVIPTQENATLFLFPLEQPVKSYRTIRRAASLIAEYLEADGLTPNSYLPSHRFKLRPDLPIHYREGELLRAETMLKEATGILTKIERFSVNNSVKMTE